jgi:hypothetical protein
MVSIQHPDDSDDEENVQCSNCGDMVQSTQKTGFFTIPSFSFTWLRVYQGKQDKCYNDHIHWSSHTSPFSRLPKTTYYTLDSYYTETPLEVEHSFWLGFRRVVHCGLGKDIFEIIAGYHEYAHRKYSCKSYAYSMVRAYAPRYYEKCIDSIKSIVYKCKKIKPATTGARTPTLEEFECAESEDFWPFNVNSRKTIYLDKDGTIGKTNSLVSATNAQWLPHNAKIHGTSWQVRHTLTGDRCLEHMHFLYNPLSKGEKHGDFFAKQCLWCKLQALEHNRISLATGEITLCDKLHLPYYGGTHTRAMKELDTVYLSTWNHFNVWVWNTRAMGDLSKHSVRYCDAHGKAATSYDCPRAWHYVIPGCHQVFHLVNDQTSKRERINLARIYKRYADHQGIDVPSDDEEDYTVIWDPNQPKKRRKQLQNAGKI